MARPDVVRRQSGAEAVDRPSRAVRAEAVRAGASHRETPEAVRVIRERLEETAAAAVMPTTLDAAATRGTQAAVMPTTLDAAATRGTQAAVMATNPATATPETRDAAVMRITLDAAATAGTPETEAAGGTPRTIRPRQAAAAGGMGPAGKPLRWSRT
jgi:hypothetical protein